MAFVSFCGISVSAPFLSLKASTESLDRDPNSDFAFILKKTKKGAKKKKNYILEVFPGGGFSDLSFHVVTE